MILLDTCTLLWLVLEADKLSARARTLLDEPATLIWLSSISAFEIGQKHAKGKLELSLPPAQWLPRALESHRLRLLELDLPSALAAAALPPIHNDPFDRLLIATARQHGLTLLTPDPKIHAYPDIKTAW
jgi:PIN domain nuclease of toxin-antitoxin system